MAKKMQTVSRQPWHRPTDVWQVQNTDGVLVSIDGGQPLPSNDCWQSPNISATGGWCFGPAHSANAAPPHKRIWRIVAASAKQRRAEALAERKAERERAAKLAKLPTRARAAITALSDKSAFGCQRASVVKLVSALLGTDIAPFV